MHATAPPSPARRDDRTAYVARQPIFDRRQRVFAYELLFRGGPANAFDANDGDHATRRTVHTSYNLMGIGDVAGEKPAFVNLTRKLLTEQFYTLLPKDRVVVELLEDVVADEQVLTACRRLKEAGYTLALDDYVDGPNHEPLLDLADIIKVDFLEADEATRRGVVERLQRPGLTFLAEKVETHELFEQAKQFGYAYFQGYFFCKPRVLHTHEPDGAKHAHMTFLSQVTRDPIDFDELERTLRTDPSLAAKLLRYINSAGFGLHQKVTSIRQALTLLGERPLRQWGSLVALTCMAEDKPHELLVVSVIRARFCELLGTELGMDRRTLDLFLLGLLSSMDALLERPIGDLLRDLPLATDIKGTLLGASTRLGKMTLLAMACERGQWRHAGVLARMLGLDADRAHQLHNEARSWADQALAL